MRNDLPSGDALPDGFVYGSDTNPHFLDVPAITELVERGVTSLVEPRPDDIVIHARRSRTADCYLTARGTDSSAILVIDSRTVGKGTDRTVAANVVSSDVLAGRRALNWTSAREPVLIRDSSSPKTSATQ